MFYGFNFSSVNKRHQLLSRLSEIKYISKYQNERKKHHAGTGSWLIETSEFKKWRSGAGSDCLWCYGIRKSSSSKGLSETSIRLREMRFVAGSGKTVLMYESISENGYLRGLILFRSSTIHALAEDILGMDITVPITPIHDLVSGKTTRCESAIIYHYCEFSDSQSLEPTSILRTLIRQLLERIAIPETLEKQMQRCFSSRMRYATPEELFQIFEDAMARFSKIYVLVDGIDECKNEDIIVVLSTFGRLLQRKIGTTIIKIIHFSRHNETISGFLNLHSHLEISTEKISHDINIFIEETVRSKISCGALEASDESLEKEVVTRLKDGAHGM